MFCGRDYAGEGILTLFLFISGSARGRNVRPCAL